MKHPRCFFGGLAAALLCMASPAPAATSISQFGITWTFNHDYPAGQFANGDWWVVGPVTITQITPSDTDGVEPHMHGSMINPVEGGRPDGAAVHGFDSRIRLNAYDHNLNVAKTLPLVVPNGSSLLSAKSVVALVDPGQQLEVVAILTVLSSAPASGSFRPAYMGSDKTIYWNKSNIDYSKLKSLSPVGGTPSLASVEARFEKTLIQLGPKWNASEFHPYYNLPFPGKGYGREITQAGSEAALSLNLNYTNAQKELLAVRFIQWGIDIYGALLNGMSYPGDGGHNGGRKLPMFMAGVLLNDNNIKARANGATYPNYFSEDQQHFYVSQWDIDTPRTAPCCGRPYEPYTQSMLGMPEWGPNIVTCPTQSYSNWGASYRTVVGADTFGNALAVHLMGLESVWNCPALFDYHDTRYYAIEGPSASNTTNYIKLYVKGLWDAYRNMPSGQSLPSPWLHQEIGTVGAAGGAGHTGSSFIVNGSGADIWSTGDQFHYAYQPVSGNCSITARISNECYSNDWTKAGVMIRETLNTDSKNAFLFKIPLNNQITTQYRAATAGVTTQPGSSSGAASYWLRLDRTGDVFTYSKSSDGVSWGSPLCSQTIVMAANVYIGFAVCSHLDGYIGTATFDNVTVTGASGYTSIKDWGFNTDGNMEGWTLTRCTATVSSGAFNITATATDPLVKSPSGLAITTPATYNKIRIRMKNNSAQTSAAASFITTSDGAWGTNGKWVQFTITPNSGYVDYILDMSTIPAWTGTIHQIRVDPLDPAVSGQTVNIDYVRITN